MAIVNTLKIYEELKEKIPEEQAKVITNVIENSFEQYRENQKEFLVTKEDTVKDISGLELKVEQLKTELKGDNANLRAELKQDIANSKAEIIKWMFIFWAGQIFALVGILFVFFKR